MPRPYNVYIVYAREDAIYMEELRRHLRPMERANRLKVWCDREINPGSRWEEAIIRNIDKADVILLMISASYYDSTYIHNKELKHALMRYEKGEVTMIPVIVRPCNFKDDPIASPLHALPENALPVTSWINMDEAWTDVVKGIQQVINNILTKKITIGIIKDPLADIEISDLDTLLNNLSENIRIKLIPNTTFLENNDVYNLDSNAATQYYDNNEIFQNYNFVFYLTDTNFKNSYFTWDAHKNLYVITFHNWNDYTNLPKANGVVYFMFAIINLIIAAENTEGKPAGMVHYKDKGCIADYLKFKTGIHNHLRSAHLCKECLGRIRNLEKTNYPSRSADAIESILRILSNASNFDLNVIDELRERVQIKKK